MTCMQSGQVISRSYYRPSCSLTCMQLIGQVISIRVRPSCRPNPDWHHPQLRKLFDGWKPKPINNKKQISIGGPNVEHPPILWQLSTSFAGWIRLRTHEWLSHKLVTANRLLNLMISRVYSAFSALLCPCTALYQVTWPGLQCIPNNSTGTSGNARADLDGRRNHWCQTE